MQHSLEPWRAGVDGEWSRGAAAHLLRRAGFGASASEVSRAHEDGPARTLDRLFAPRGHDPKLFAGIASLLAAGDVEALQAWWMALILGGGDPLRERTTLAWHNHFATSEVKVADVRAMYRQNQSLRELALGDFRVLLHTLARDPAMLLWLDGNDNQKGHANENFAREVLELFALGIGNYTERDIQEAARAFTGWGTEGREFVVRATQHDAGTKTVFGRTGNFDGDQLIDLVLAHPACPTFVAKRLIREFVSIDVPREVVEALGAELVRTHWSIGATLRTLLASRLFFSTEVRRARIASPVEFVAGSLRTLEAQAPPLEAAQAASRMGQALFRPPSVKGWDGGRAWINAGSWIARCNFGFELAAGCAGKSASLHVERAFDASDRRALRERVLDAFVTEPTDGGLNRALEEATARAASDVDALQATVGLVLSSPEYQLV